MSIVTNDIPHAVAAFMRRIEKTIRPDSPGFCLVIAGPDGRPYTLARANRTELVVAGTQLLFEAVDQDKQAECVCANCDNWTNRARHGLVAMGHRVEAPN